MQGLKQTSDIETGGIRPWLLAQIPTTHPANACHPPLIPIPFDADLTRLTPGSLVNTNQPRWPGFSPMQQGSTLLSHLRPSRCLTSSRSTVPQRERGNSPMHDHPSQTQSLMWTRTWRTETSAGARGVEKGRGHKRKRVVNNATRSWVENSIHKQTDSQFAPPTSSAITPLLRHGGSSIFQLSYQSSLLSYHGHSGENT